jgi:hypothetical protein
MDHQAWGRFVDICRKDFKLCDCRQELIAACGGYEDIAIVAFYHSGRHAAHWISTAIPALEGKIPAELIADGKADEVRTCLWRSP